MENEPITIDSLEADHGNFLNEFDALLKKHNYSEAEISFRKRDQFVKVFAESCADGRRITKVEAIDSIT